MSAIIDFLKEEIGARLSWGDKWLV